MTTIEAPEREVDPGQDAEDQKRTRVVLVDDNPTILETITQVLRNSYIIVGAFLDGKSVLQEWTNLCPDVLVLDISMGGLSGLEVAENLQTLGSRVKIVFLTVYEDSEFITSAFAAGASAYVFKSRVTTDLIQAIDKARMGNRFVSAPRMY
ncbi:MAG TPA: response regulator transcription factor [Candidatus Angelobacter sp.]